MDEKEEFQKILNYLAAKYELTVVHPYGDGFIQLSRNGIFIGEMNYDGFSLCNNLYNLTGIIEKSGY